MGFVENLKSVMNKTGLAVASRRDECYIPAVGDRGDQFLRLCGTVTEIVFS
jgi:hypothetical protein